MVDSSIPFSISDSRVIDTSALYDVELRAHLERHIEHGDFFLLLATIFGFLEETAADPDSVPVELRTMQVALARSVRTNLHHISKNYHVRAM